MRRMKVCLLVMFLGFGLWLGGASAEQCGWQSGGAVCPNNYCCSSSGYCGTIEAYCGAGCQSGPCWDHAPPPPVPSPPPTPVPPAPPGQKDITDIIDADLFEDLLKHRNDPICEGHGFYSYNAFITAARAFDGFGTTGNETTRKRELAAFLGQTSHETNGGGSNMPDGPYAWGYCFIRELNQIDSYCDYNCLQWPCVTGQKYFGRGPIQLSYNCNYGQAGDALGIDLLSNPDLVAQDPIVSFKTAIWFWMTPQGIKPSCHKVIVDKWIPSPSDIVAGRVPGYGVITNIINGGIECGISGPNANVENRIGYYKTFCNKLSIEYGDNLDCYNQRPFNEGVKLSYEI